MGAISSSVHTSVLTWRKGARVNKHAKLCLNGMTVCLKMFLFAYNFSKKRYSLLRNRFNKYGVSLEYHGNMNNQNHSMTPETMTNIITFVEKFSELNGYHQPSDRVSSLRNATILLPSDITKKNVNITVSLNH